MYQSIRLTRSTLALAISTALCFSTTGAFAQQNDNEDEDIDLVIEEVVVTGTYIAGLNEDVLPVTVMSDQAIEKLGAVNMQDILSYIPSISDFEFEDSNNGTNGARGDVAGVNMRGLGSGNTLVLLNGRRMVAHPVSQTVNSVPVITYNVNSVPSSAIRRIEVLRDGAAPLYGADAIAGVVNFVPYTEFDGIRLSGRYGWSEDTNYDETEVTAAGGFDFNGGASRLGIYATWYDRSHVHMDEIGDLYYELDRRNNTGIPEEWRGDSQLNNLSSLGPWAQFQTGTLRDDGQWLSSGTFHVDPDTGAIDSGSQAYRYNFNETAWVTPATERLNMMITFNHDFGDGLEFFGDFSYYDADSLTQRAPSPFDQSLAFIVVPEEAYWNTFGEEVLITHWRPVDLGPRIIDTNNNSWRALAGLRGELGEWNWDTAFVWSEAESTDTEGNRQSKTLFQQALLVDGPLALNPFVGPGGNSQETFDLFRVEATDVRESDLMLWDLRVNRDRIFGLFGNDVGAAFGLEWRHEGYVDDRDPRLDGSMPYEDGLIFDESDLVGVSATFDSKGDRDTYSAYGELYLPLVGEANDMPLVRAFDIQLAARYENPDDFDDTVKPKIGLRWEPVEGLSFRASYTEGFRAPNLQQLNQGTIVRRLQGIEDPLREGVTGKPVDEGDTYRYTTRVANPDLEPEDAETTLVGFVWAPTGFMEGFRFGVDWWNIKLEGAVGLVDNDEQLALDALLRSQGSFNPNVIRADITPEDLAAFNAYNAANPNDQRTPVGEAVNIISQYLNLEPRELEGWDANLMYAFPELGIGQFIFRTDITKITKLEQQGLATSDLLRSNGNPELRYTVALDWELGGFDANVTMRYVDDVYDTSLYDTIASGNSGTVNEAQNRVYWDVDSWTVYNLALGYDFDGNSGFTDGLRLSGGVRNITDEDPPFADESFGYFTSLHNSYGRVFWLKADYQF